MQISFSRPQAGCKFYSVGRHPDANFIQSAASRMQIANCIRLVAMQYKIPSLHAAGDQPNAICILLAARQIQSLKK
jgi:hypothetical protein